MLAHNSLNTIIVDLNKSRIQRTWRPNYGRILNVQLISPSLISLSRKKEEFYRPNLCRGGTIAHMTTKKEPLGLEDDASLLEGFSKIPSIGKVWMVPSGNDVRVSMELSQKDLPQNSSRKILVNFMLNQQTVQNGEADTFISLELPDVIFVSPSPSGKKVFVAKKSENKKEMIVQIWNKVCVEYELIIPEKLHGPIVNDGWFGNRASWSPDESLVAYVAERPKAKETPEWGADSGEGDCKDGANVTRKTWKGIGEFEEDWGEANTGKRAPAVYVLDIKDKQVTSATNLDPDESYGQPNWSHNQCLVYVKWSHESSVFPRIKQRLGMVYCFNRPCVIMACDWPNCKDTRPLTSSHQSAFSPRFTKSGDMIFLSQDNAVKTGKHNATPSLHVLRACDNAPLIQVPDAGAICLQGTSMYSKDPNVFPGMYTAVLPEHSIINVEGRDIIYITVQWRSCLAVVAVDISSGKLTRVSPTDDSSWSLLGVTENRWIMLQKSNPSCPSKIYVGRAGFESINLNQVRIPDLDMHPETICRALGTIRHDILDVVAHDSSMSPIKSFEATLIHNGHKRPTLLIPHGGPHSAYSTQFIPSISFLTAVGFNIITVNYRGSTGFGEDSLQCLPGKIGDQDVKDCYQALQKGIETGLVLEDRVAVVGGSHGGFLSGHLIGQYPDLFKSAVMRNPVCNISLMVHVTDIPDWCFIETFGTNEGLKRAQNRVTSDDLREMKRRSPIAYVDNVEAPVLMMLGGADRRVPMDDGKRYIAQLRQNEHPPDTRIIVFENDEHGLTKPQTDFEQWLTALWWLNRML